MFAAASLTNVFEPLAEAFERSYPDLQLKAQFASTGALREQLLSGAPADVFLSADQQSIELLGTAGVTNRASSFATNDLVVASPVENAAGATSVDDLHRNDVLIGLCVDSAPCGALADDALATVGVIAQVATREPNAAALASKLRASEIDLAVVYRSDVVGSEGELVVVDELDDASDGATYFSSVIGAESEAPTAFIEFLSSGEAQEILDRAGFGTPSP